MKKLILGVEIGGTKLQLAAGDSRGEILGLQHGRVNPETGADGIRHWLLEQIPSFIARFEAIEDSQVVAIGCGFGGPIDTHAGTVMNSIQITGWQNFPLREWFVEHFNRPAFVTNDSNAATWGEYRLGFGKGCRHFFYTNMGSGVGGGFVFNGELFDGRGFGAGEFGHTYVPDWTAEEPGRGVEIEKVCSGWAIESRINHADYLPPSSRLYPMRSEKDSPLTVRDLGKAAGLGDPFALQEIDRIAHSMGYGLANVLSLTGVERITIGGGVSNLGAILIEPIQKYLRAYVFITNQGRYDISQCELGDQVVLVGAILLANQAIGIL